MYLSIYLCIYLSILCSDFLVKIVDLIDTCKVTTLEGHEAPILCVQFDSLGMFLVCTV